MWFTKAKGENVDYVESRPTAHIYKNRMDGSMWYIVNVACSTEPRIVTAYEVNQDGSLLYKRVDGVTNIFPEGQPAHATLDDFLKRHVAMTGFSWEDFE